VRLRVPARRDRDAARDGAAGSRRARGDRDVLELLHAGVRLHAREGRGRAVRLGQARVRRPERRGPHARRPGAVRTRTGRLHPTLRRRDDRRGARRLLGRLGAAARRALDRRTADTIGDRDGRERGRPAAGLATERQRVAVRPARNGDRRRERAREQRGVAMAGTGRVCRGLAAALRDEPDRAARPPAVTVRSRALGAGLAIALVYAATAILSGHLSPLSSGPLLDGLAPPTAYRWVKPPPELAATNQEPTPGTFTVKLGNGGSKTAVFTTDDAQVTLILPEGSFADAEGQRSVQVAVDPLAGDLDAALS